jgi:NTP pyrophosphatase (non-canonical NTP hydrolase)
MRPNDNVNRPVNKSGDVVQKGKSYFEDVVLWNKALKFPVRKKPAAFIGEEELKSQELGMRLVTEEFKELCKAFEEMDYQEISDACGDLVWVVCGLMARLGLNLDAAWEEIRRTNWNKVGGPRRADGKLLKPEGWQPPSMVEAVKGIPKAVDESQCLLSTPRNREEVLELWKQAKIQLGEKYKATVVPEFTCVDCSTVYRCQLAFDLHNTNGDCLLTK